MKKWIIKKRQKQNNNKDIYRKNIKTTTNMIKTVTKCRKNANLQNVKIRGLQKTFFSGFLNWILGHLQSPDDENKMAIREISIRAIQKLSDLDQQTIVGGPNFNLTNGKISFIFQYFFIPTIFLQF